MDQLLYSLRKELHTHCVGLAGTSAKFDIKTHVHIAINVEWAHFKLDLSLSLEAP